MVIGDSVRILPPFAEFYPEVYVISNIQDTTCWLEGLEGAFDFMYLEKV